MTSTIVDSLGEAMAVVSDGDTVFVGGFGQCVPFAAAHELVRSGRRDLTLCRTGADILFDQLIAAGCVSKVVVGWIGNPGLGVAHAYRRALRDGSLEEEQWSNFSLALRLLAGRLGVPFLPSHTLSQGGVPAALRNLSTVKDPYSDVELVAVPALTPDVALVHAQRCDDRGNLQMWGVTGDTVDGAMASRRIVATVEEVVSTDTVRSSSGLTVVPAHRVDAVVVVPGVARPSYVHDYYPRDDAYYADYDVLARSESDLFDHVQDLVRAGSTA